MLQTFEAVIDEQGHVRLVEPIKLPTGWRVLVTILERPIVSVSETALLSEPALAEDWNRPEEDEAWSHLLSDFTDYLSNLEDYENHLARGEIQW